MIFLSDYLVSNFEHQLSPFILTRKSIEIVKLLSFVIKGVILFFVSALFAKLFFFFFQFQHVFIGLSIVGNSIDLMKWRVLKQLFSLLRECMLSVQMKE